jgi:hypothetical protein
MVPTAHIVHRLRGRLRLKIPEKRWDKEWLAETASQLRKLRGVDKVDLSSVSGSLLIHHQPDAAVEQRLKGSKRFRVIDVPISDPPLLDRVADGVHRSNRALERRTGGRTNLRTLLILVLVILAFVQTLRGRVMVPAISLLLFAAQLALMAKNKPNQQSS